jgi:thiol-disulfide isomerase/thioredoxin
MNIARNFSNFVVLIVLLAFGCQNTKSDDQSGTTSEEKSAEVVGFTPNPQQVPEQEVTTLAINAIAPDFNLPGTDERFYSLKNFADAKVLVIVFLCNHCPTAQAYEDRIIRLVEDYKDQSVRVVAISPNAVNAVLLEELGYSDMGDSFEEMQIRAKDKNYNFVYLYDGDTQEASIKYGPVATPHVFVFDNERNLKYTGRLDKSEKPDTANADELRAAIDAVLLNAVILEPVTKSFGCSVKWGWKMSWTNKVNEDWAKLPVTLEPVNSQGVLKLIRNESDKLRLINIWATWCGPCVIEYPEFINIHRMYQARDFEFVSLSADKIEHKDKALKFLQGKNSAVKNYIYSESDIYQLIESVDKEWDGALPYTILLEPGGNVVYKKMGTIEPLELKKVIVDHPMIGRYY